MWGFQGGIYLYCGVCYYDVEPSKCHTFREIYVGPRTTLKMKAVCATERALPTYKNAKCHIQEYQNTCKVITMFKRQNNWNRIIRSLNKFLAFYENTEFVSFLLRPRHWSLAWPMWLHYIIHFNGPQAKIWCGLSKFILTCFVYLC